MPPAPIRPRGRGALRSRTWAATVTGFAHDRGAAATREEALPQAASMPTNPPSKPFGHQISGRLPALDGLRGLALVGMLAWHARLDWVKGGFARMTIFFVLSGFLGAASLHPAPAATRPSLDLLLPAPAGPAPSAADPHRRGGGDRRDRRCRVGRGPPQPSGRRRVGARSACPTGGSSPTLGPTVPCSRARRRSNTSGRCRRRSSASGCSRWCSPSFSLVTRQRTWAVMAVLAAALLAIPVFVDQSPDAIYYGTPNRAGEFLAGAALALWIDRRARVGESTADRSTGRTVLRVVGAGRWSRSWP